MLIRDLESGPSIQQLLVFFSSSLSPIIIVVVIIIVICQCFQVIFCLLEYYRFSMIPVLGCVSLLVVSKNKLIHASVCTRNLKS